MRQTIPCKTCETGHLKKRKRYRMSGVVVLIGYILLIPSLFGMALGTMGVVATGGAAGEVTKSMERDARRKLTAAEVPAAVVEQVATQQPVAAGAMNQLSDPQRRAVQDVKMELAARTVGAGAGVAIVGAGSAFVIVGSLVGGLLGWLLVMKKKVLQCNACGAVVAAS